jgi:hypothetical protein
MALVAIHLHPVDLTDTDRTIAVLQQRIDALERAEETRNMALTQEVQQLVDQVAATRGAVESQTALVKGIPAMIEAAIAKDRAANPSLGEEDFAAIRKVAEDLKEEQTQVELADAVLTNPPAEQEPATPQTPATPPVAGA